MKKLMVAAAAALTATIGFSVESSNIVGYMDKDMASSGYYNYTPMFVGVGGADPAVKDIVPSTSDTTVEDLGGSMILLYVLDTNRKFAKTFAYMTEDDFMDEDGWYYGDEETPTNYELAPGEVLQLKAPYQVKLSFPAQNI